MSVIMSHSRSIRDKPLSLQSVPKCSPKIHQRHTHRAWVWSRMNTGNGNFIGKSSTHTAVIPAPVCRKQSSNYSIFRIILFPTGIWGMHPPPPTECTTATGRESKTFKLGHDRTIICFARRFQRDDEIEGWQQCVILDS
jgi:hypothetical protein